MLAPTPIPGLFHLTSNVCSDGCLDHAMLRDSWWFIDGKDLVSFAEVAEAWCFYIVQWS